MFKVLDIWTQIALNFQSLANVNTKTQTKSWTTNVWQIFSNFIIIPILSQYFNEFIISFTLL